MSFRSQLDVYVHEFNLLLSYSAIDVIYRFVLVRMNFTVNFNIQKMDQQESINTLCGMGFPMELVQTALSQSDSFEGAMDWLFAANSSNNNNHIISGMHSIDNNGDDDEEEEIEEYKVVLVIRADLKMSPGKVAAQCVHAALGVYRNASNVIPRIVSDWENSGEKTVSLTCNTEQEFDLLYSQAVNANIPCYYVCDAGRTEIQAGSKTVLAIGPDTNSKINSITGHLRLYK